MKERAVGDKTLGLNKFPDDYKTRKKKKWELIRLPTSVSNKWKIINAVYFIHDIQYNTTFIL